MARGRQRWWSVSLLLTLASVTAGCGGGSSKGDAARDVGNDPVQGDSGGADAAPDKSETPAPDSAAEALDAPTEVAAEGGDDTSVDLAEAGMAADEGTEGADATDPGVDAPIEAADAAPDAGADAVDTSVAVDAGVDTAAPDAAAEAPVADAAADSGGDACVLANQRVTTDPASSSEAALVWSGSGYGLAWNDTRDGNTEIYFARLDAAGTKIGGDVRITNAAGTSESTSIVWTGSTYAIAWYDNRDGNYEIYMARVDSDGVKVGSDLRVTNNAATSWGQAMAWSGSEYGLVWWEDRDGNYEIYFAHVSDTTGMKVGGDVRLTTNSATSDSPAIVWNGTGYGVAWSDWRDSSSEIYFAALDAAGAKLTGDVRVTVATGSSGLPSIVWTGSEYGLGWEDSRSGTQQLYFVRLDTAGAKVGSELPISARLFTPWNVVWTGGGYGLAWTDSRAGNLEIYFNRLDPSGNKLGGDLRVTTDPASSTGPSLTWNGATYGVAWGDSRPGNAEMYFSEICP